MAKFRKKPVVIEAVQFYGFEGTKRENIPEELSQFYKDITALEYMGNTTIGLLICTLEGNLHVSMGDWIIRGVNGEVYPCKPDIFEKTYEPL